MPPGFRLLRVLGLLLLAGASPALAQRSQSAPEASTGRTEKTLQRANSFMVAAANPLATAAGVEMLKAGGSAVDAAIAVQLVLNLVEPQSSGLGGGAYLLHWNSQARQIVAYDGREFAPAAATPDRFLRAGEPLPFEAALQSGLSIGVPGTPRLLEVAHRAHGRLPWARLFEPAIKLAEGGFPVSPRLNLLLQLAGPGRFDPAARAYFFDAQGSARPVGYRLVNPAFAVTLRAIQDGGVEAFYGGAIAQAIVRAASQPRSHPGDLTAQDLAGYRVEVREPVCIEYRRHRICGMAPSSSGGLTVAQVLRLLEPFDLGRGPGAAMNPRALHLIAEAEKLAFADRDRYIGDPAFVRVPPGMTDPAYLAGRGRLINPAAVMARPPAGSPPGSQARLPGIDATLESVGTSHVSIVDGAGNAVSMTTTIEAAFGSGAMAAGFLLNNELTDFAFQPRDTSGRLVANAVAPLKRPRSSMAPTLIFDSSGNLMAALGSPGGSRIILYLVKAIVAMVDWELDAQSAAALLNFGSRGTGFEIEDDPVAPISAIVAPLRQLGHVVVSDQMTSGTHVVRVTNQGLEGGADPRREGVAAGD